MRKCLLCDEDMIQKVIEEVEIDLCVTCGGVWLDGGELELLTGHHFEEIRELTCPDCKTVMVTKPIGNVEIDYCAECGGVWLDKGELEDISNIAPECGGVKKNFTKFKDSVAVQRNVEIAKLGRQIMETGEGSATINDVFVMYKDGLLISCCTRDLSPTVDEDILAGMLMAIQDFVKVSFGALGDSILHSIRFGDRQIIIERGDHIITAMVVSGELPPHLQDQTIDVIKEIEDRYGVHLTDWNGNLTELKGVTEIIRKLIEKEKVKLGERE